MGELKSNEQRAKTAIMLIWIVLVIKIISLISGYFQYDLLQTVANGGTVSEEAADANDLRERIISIVYLIAFVISAITFIQWFRRAYFNLHLKLKYLEFSEGWAAGSWFVPVLNLFRPYQIMYELYMETKSLLIKKGFTLNNELSIKSIILWWTLWIVNNIIGQIIFRFPTVTIDNLLNFSMLSMVFNVLGIPLSLITVKIIKDYAAVEPLLFEIEENVSTTNQTK